MLQHVKENCGSIKGVYFLQSQFSMSIKESLDHCSRTSAHRPDPSWSLLTTAIFAVVKSDQRGVLMYETND